MVAPMMPKSLIAPRETVTRKRSLVMGVEAGRLDVNEVLLYGPINTPYRIKTIMEHVKAGLFKRAQKDARKEVMV